MYLTNRFASAVDYARIAHTGQLRKGTRIPYFAHLIGVASLVLEYGGDEDQAIAGLLHDLLEDCGEEHEPAIREEFGKRVAMIVRECTDGTAEAKAGVETDEARLANWFVRKRAYLAHLGKAEDDVLLVSACDKLHNARAILQDLDNPAEGTKVFGRFKAGQEGTLRYYAALSDIFTSRKTAIARDLRNVVQQLLDRVGAQWEPLDVE